MYDSNYPDNGSPGPYSRGLNQNISNETIAQKIVQKLNANLPVAQIKRAVDKFKSNIMPRIYMIQAVHTVVNAVSQFSANIDSTYGFFCTGWTVLFEGTQDADYYITNLSLPSSTNLIAGNLQFPAGLLTRWTAFPLEWMWYVPANSQIQLTTQNGGTTAASVANFAFCGVCVPDNYIQEIMRGNVK